MSQPSAVKPTDIAIKEYHDRLVTFTLHAAVHEGATETAFSHLLSVIARPHGWTLIPKKKLKVAGKLIFPGGNECRH